MSFFKDFKEDLSQAVNELMPENEAVQVKEVVPTPVAEPVAEPASIGQDELASMLNNLDSLMAAEAPVVETPVVEPVPVAPVAAPVVEPVAAPIVEPVAVAPVVEPVPVAPVAAPVVEPVAAPVVEPVKSVVEPVFAPEPVIREEQKIAVAPIFGNPDVVKESPINTVKNVSDMEVGVITSGMVINGDITSDGSLDIRGSVKGNITIEGKLDVTGSIQGNSVAEEVFADGAKIIGEIKCNGSVKVGQSSVVRGNITASAAVLAGAIKGDIDVQGPVILDSTAVIMGNIKSKSIQINNGAVIEGLCSQCYADVTPMSFFGEDKPAPAAKSSKSK